MDSVLFQQLVTPINCTKLYPKSFFIPKPLRRSPISVHKFGSCCSSGESLNGSLCRASQPESGIVDGTDFFVSDADGDPDKPSPGYCSIGEALEALRQNKFVIVVDMDETGRVEGNLVMAASQVTAESIAFMVKYGSGMISVGMKEEDLQRLKLPLMFPENEEDITSPSFTVTVDAKSATSTGASASDRAKTVLVLSSPVSTAEDLRKPGHIFPLRYRNGGVLTRVGHTEASVDLVALAGSRPVSVFVSLIDPGDGSIATMPTLRKMAYDHRIPIVSIVDLIRYRRKREKIIERMGVSHLQTEWGSFEAHSYRSKIDGIEHVAMVKGNIGSGQDVLVRIHSECLTGDIFGSRRCDCGNQLHLAMQLIQEAGRGVLVYLRGQEGRGIGLGQKLRAYNLQDQGHDTVEANLKLGLSADSREYGIGAQILHDIGVHTMRLMTNNPAKFAGIKGYGLAVVGRIPLLTVITEENKRYLETKRVKMGHIYGSDLQGTPHEFFMSSNSDMQEERNEGGKEI